MRRRSLRLALVVGGLAVGAGVTTALAAPPARDDLTVRSPSLARPELVEVTLIAVGILVCAAMVQALRDPAFVDHVTVDNPNALEVDVDVSSSPGGAVLALAAVQPRSQATTPGVVDQGDEWVFQFKSGGVDGGALRVSRAKLAAALWRVVIPADVAGRLQSRAFVPAYR